MKRWICLFLTCLLLLPLFGCRENEPEPTIASPVCFYYRRTEPVYAGEHSVIAPEIRESAGHEADFVYLLNLYLKGPETDGLHRTFPKNVSVVDLQIQENSARIVVNDEFSYMAGMDLTFACVCLTRTLCEMTGVQRVTIDTPNSLLDGNEQITIHLSDILLTDTIS